MTKTQNQQSPAIDMGNLPVRSMEIRMTNSFKSMLKALTKTYKYNLIRAWGSGENGGPIVRCADSVEELVDFAIYLQKHGRHYDADGKPLGGGVNATYYVLPSGLRGDDNVIVTIPKVNQ